MESGSWIQHPACGTLDPDLRPSDLRTLDPRTLDLMVLGRAATSIYDHVSGQTHVSGQNNYPGRTMYPGIWAIQTTQEEPHNASRQRNLPAKLGRRIYPGKRAT